MAIILFILVLSFLVIIHELGHFVVAKLFKIRVEEFGFGYPPRALTLFKKSGTIFSLNWIPFGGFVRLEGEEGEPPADNVSADTKPTKKLTKTEGPFYAQSATRRLLVILAGAGVNFVFGVIAFSAVFSWSGIPSGAIISQIAPNSPAAHATIPAQVAITAVKIDSHLIPTRSSSEIVQVIQQHRGQTIKVVTTGPCRDTTCETGTNEYQVYIRLPNETPANEGAMGVAFSSDYFSFYPWYQQIALGIKFGIEQAINLGWQMLVSLSQMVVNLVTKGIVPPDVTGPVGIAYEANQSGFLGQGPLVLLLFAGLLSINLAIMNVLPIPALDGGRALFILLEKIIGRSRIQRIEGYANYGGFIFLICLVVLITVRDVFRIVGGG